MLAYFLRGGKLPWMGHSSDDDGQGGRKFKRIKEIKEAVTPQELFEGCPKEFVSFLQYSKSIPFEAKPDYEFLKELFLSVIATEGLTDEV